VSTALDERAAASGTADGGGPARRAVVRWAWRLFRREWRQQLLVLALLTVAVAATTVGEAVATNVPSSPDEARLGTANHLVTLPGSDPQLAADIAAAHKWFGTIDVITHQKIALPGSVDTVDLRAQEPNGPYGHGTLRLVAGRYPTSPTEVAVTRRVADLFNLRIGGTWQEGARTRQVTGLVENPKDLQDRFALVAPGQANPPDHVTILLNTAAERFRGFRLPSGRGLDVEIRSSDAKKAAAIGVLVLATIGLLFVGLLAVAGFTVMAQRRLRALGMLGSLGATDRHVRLVMLANGAVVGAVAAAVGAAVGLAGWLAFAPRLETIAERRIYRFDLPWWAIAAAMLLAVVTAIVAAWWPARSAARIPVVAALSGRPPRPQPAHRFATLGVLLVLAGIGFLGLSHQRTPLLIVGGIVATTVGVLLLAPLGIRAIAACGQRSSIGVRLALRDLARYQARSGAALGAVTLAIGIAAAIAVGATASQAAADATSGGNLPANELIVWLGGDGANSPIPEQTPAQLDVLRSRVDGLASSLHAQDVVALDAAVNPAEADVPGLGNGPGGKAPVQLAEVTELPRGFEARGVGTLYVATSAVLAHYGIKPSQVDPTADILTSRTGLAGLQLLSGGAARQTMHPKIQMVNLPSYSSDPNTLITTRTLHELGLRPLRAGWLIEARGPITSAQVDAARKSAVVAGLTIETRPTQQSLSRLRNEATAVGVLVALGVLAMTVGLIRSETANELRTLTATGASSTTRRTLTGATAGALALLGALLGTAGAYFALIAWYRSHLHPLTHVPTVDLIVIVVGLPVVATAAGWLLAGREPPAVARRPLE
jgi:putative ABC transport system permease protein